MTAPRVTLLHVAQRAGVSRTTASFVMTGRRDMRISSDAEQRVLRAARELSCRPSLLARSLRTNLSQTIGLLSDVIASRSSPERSSAAAFRPHFCTITCCSSGRPGATQGSRNVWSKACSTGGRRIRLCLDIHPKGCGVQGAAGQPGGAAELHGPGPGHPDRASGRA